jgi:hypothetical protein
MDRPVLQHPITMLWQEKIAVNSEIPLGKLLLGALYNLLNRVSQCLMKSEVVPTIIGP